MGEQQSDGEWGPWVVHDGWGCPMAIMGRYCHLLFKPDSSQPYNPPLELFDTIDDLKGSCASWWGAKYDGKGYAFHWGNTELQVYWVCRYRVWRPKQLVSLINIAEGINRCLTTT